jgi:hypothetical protein
MFRDQIGTKWFILRACWMRLGVKSALCRRDLIRNDLRPSVFGFFALAKRLRLATTEIGQMMTTAMCGRASEPFP